MTRCPECGQSFCQLHGRRGVGVCTKGVLRRTIGRILKSATLIVALICLAGWWEQSSTGSPDNILGTLPGEIIALISPDGQWLASGGFDGSVGIWDVTRRKVETTLEGKRGPVYGLACSPDGTLLATACFDGTVTLWDTKSWGVRREFQADSTGLRSLAFSPAGTLL